MREQDQAAGRRLCPRTCRQTPLSGAGVQCAGCGPQAPGFQGCPSPRGWCVRKAFGGASGAEEDGSQAGRGCGLSHLTALFFVWGRLCSFSPFIRTPPSPVVGRILGGPYGLVGTSWGPWGERRPHCHEWPPVSTGRSSWGEGRGVTSSEGASWKVRKQKQLGRNETSSPV